jgi:hypothetical protein
MGDGAGAFAFWLMVGAGQVAFWVAMGPVIRAFADRLRGRAALSEEIESRLQALEARSPVTGETDAVYRRLEEVEERVEFTERLLAQSRTEGALSRGDAK